MNTIYRSNFSFESFINRFQNCLFAKGLPEQVEVKYLTEEEYNEMSEIYDIDSSRFVFIN